MMIVRRMLLPLLTALALTSCSDPWGTDDGKIALYVEVDRAIIGQGAQLTIVATARNIGTDSVSFAGPADCLIYFEVLSRDGITVYNQAEECSRSATTVTLPGGKSECCQKMAVVPVTSAQLADYTGAYHSDELNITYKVLLDGEQLFLKGGYSPQDNLNPVTQDIFTSRYVDFRFERDERNQVCGFRLGAGRVRNIRFRKH